MSGRLARLARLEYATSRSLADRGSYCPQCGGIGGEDAMLALDTLDRQGTRMTVDEANAVCDNLGEGDAACRLCGELTLVGTLRHMLAADEQR
jgi:hypothetical protein